MTIGDNGKWKTLKSRLESFGQASGLFDEISVNRLGGRGGPFQLNFRKYAGEDRGPHHNLIDVGYGVSQALPLLTELLRDDAPGLFLLQQPEVHLHPRAQAELGSLFCQLAGPERQFIVEDAQRPLDESRPHGCTRPSIAARAGGRVYSLL